MWGSITLLTFGAIHWGNPTQWYRPYHFDPYSDFWRVEFTSMVEADNGDILLAGTTENGYEEDIACMRIDSRGNIIWKKTYNQWYPQETQDIIQLETNRFLLICNNEPYHEHQAWLFCIDGQGNHIWNNTLGEPNRTLATAGVSCPEGGALIVGQNSIANVSGYNYWGVRVDSTGNVLWNTSLIENGDFFIKDVVRAHDGSFVATGTAYVYPRENYNRHMFAVRINSTGAILWNQTFGEDYSETFAITQGADETLLIAGKGRYYPGLLINLNLDGTFNWNRTILDSTRIHSLVPLPTGYLCIGDGYARVSTSTLWVGQVDFYGSLLWSWEIGDGNPVNSHYQGLESQTGGFLLLSGEYWSNLLVRISDPPRNDTLLYYTGFGVLLILLVILIIFTIILIRYHSNQENSPNSWIRKPTVPLAYTLGLYCYTLSSWLSSTIMPLLYFSTPIYPNFNQNVHYITIFPFDPDSPWRFGDIVFLGPTAILPIIIGMLTFALLQSALLYLEIQGEKRKPSSYRLKGTSIFTILDLIFVVSFGFLINMILPWLIVPFFMGILLIGFYPKYLLIRRWTPQPCHTIGSKTFHGRSA